MNDIRTRYLSDSEASRIYSQYPRLGRSYRDYCPTCDTKGTYRWLGETITCDCEYQLQLHKWYLASGIGVTYQRLDFDDFQGPQSTLDQVRRWLQMRKGFLKRGMGLYFYGPCGTGKTMLANLVVKELIKDGYDCWATTFSQMVQMFTAGWGDRQEQTFFQRKFVGSEVLLLDDVLITKGVTPALTETTFDAVLRQRVQTGRTTLITTNMTPESTQTQYGASTLSLIKEKSLSLGFEGEDFRTSARERETDEILLGEVRPIV